MEKQEKSVVINVTGDKNVLNFYGETPRVGVCIASGFSDDPEPSNENIGIAPMSTQSPGRP